MDTSPIPEWLIWFAPAWVVFFVVLSALMRGRRGKPIVPKVPASAVYAERSASGGMASNCLIVAVTPDALVVTPRFPFNLMFLPEIYGMDHVIPLSMIREATAEGSGKSQVAIAFRDNRRSLRLKVRDPAALLAALNRRRTP